MAKNPKSAAILGLILCIPGILMFLMLILHIEVPAIDRLVEPAAPDQPQVLGSLIALTLIVILPLIAFLINFAAIRQTLRNGGTFFAHPGNVLIVAFGFLVVASFVAGVVIDQYPCWMGVPNCD